MHIRQYLVGVAERMTAHAPALPGDEPRERWQQRRRRMFWHMLGIDRYMSEAPNKVTSDGTRYGPDDDDLIAPWPLNVRVTQSHKRDGYRIDCLCYESLPGLRVEANLYVPHGSDKHPAPALLYVCGHSEHQKASHYQQHARRWAQLGFVVLIVDTVQFGEVRGYHHGTHRYGWFHWVSRGYTPAGVEVWNGIRGLDFLRTLPEVDADRLGVTGISGGGAMTWWIAAADRRVKVASPACGTSTIASHVRERTVDGHCDCMFPVNLYGWSLADMSALVAPRPLLIVSADRDGIFTIDAIETFHRQMARVYDDWGASDRLKLLPYRSPHAYSPLARRTTYQWFLKHLAGQEVALDDVDDVDDHTETVATLRVYTDGLPANNRATTVHDWFVPKAEAPVIEDADDLAAEKARVKAGLARTAFQAFPENPPDPQVETTMEWMHSDDDEGRAFTFASDEGWRLPGMTYAHHDGDDSSPTIVRLLATDETRSMIYYSHIPGAPPGWRRAALAPRGTGDTVWAPGLQWHLRRASALTGRTIASMRVFDVLQGLKALRSIHGGNTHRFYLSGRGEMAVVALYAALLDDDVEGVVLYDPPATHDAPGQPDGTGSASELLGVLQWTDLPYVAGLLWPRRLVFVGGRPTRYEWAEHTYDRLGSPGAWWHVADLKHWDPPDR